MAQSSGDETLKRDRVESDEFTPDSPDSKRVRLDSGNLVREDFLEMLEEELDTEPEIQGLESVIRSLEREINPPTPAPVPELMDETLVFTEPDRIELGYLLEASDDELGLPPTEAAGAGSEIDPSPIDSRTADLSGGGLVCEDEIGGGENENRAGDLLTMDGLFEYGGYVDDSGVPELQCWPESMPAL